MVRGGIVRRVNIEMGGMVRWLEGGMLDWWEEWDGEKC